MPAWEEVDEHPPRERLVVERTDADADERIVPEQLYRRPFRGLRNALPMFEPGVERVVVRTDGHVVGDALGRDADRRRFSYEGETFEATREEVSDGE